MGAAYGDRWVFRGLNLRLKPGERVALRGPSGCGKTTLLRVAAGLLPPREGSVRRTCRTLAYAFQEPRLAPWLTLEENLLLVLGTPGLTPEVRDLLDRFGLGGLEKRRPAALSGGQRQRAGLVRALSVHPDLILLDEPFGSLDRDLRDRLLEEVRAILRGGGTGALLVTHDPREAEALTDRSVLLPSLPEIDPEPV